MTVCSVFHKDSLSKTRIVWCKGHRFTSLVFSKLDSHACSLFYEKSLYTLHSFVWCFPFNLYENSTVLFSFLSNELVPLHVAVQFFYWDP